MGNPTLVLALIVVPRIIHLTQAVWEISKESPSVVTLTILTFKYCSTHATSPAVFVNFSCIAISKHDLLRT